MNEFLKKNRWAVALILSGILGLLLFVFGNIREKDSAGQNAYDARSEKEKELAVFLEESQGVDEVLIKLCVDEEGRIIGAAVLCSGGNDPVVKAQITRLLSAALGLPTNKIEVDGKG
ncbi:MAG: hypothetical protein IJY89_06865 [Clostridia bacterium]|nr:hypothetical protein [Clostridia bacterium]